MAKVTLEHVKMGYSRKKLAIDDVSLTIESGEFFVLVGPSGCGKTSLLRLISGISVPQEGDVLFNDVSVRDTEPQKRNVAMVFQNFALYPHLSVYRNIAYPLESRKMPKQEIDRKVREIAEVFGISGLLDRRPRVLSGGQRQLVAIARAMVRHPDVFLLDEPFANLDIELRDTLRAQVRKAHRLMPDTTFIYVTHDQREAMTLSDRMAVMKDGKIAAQGRTMDVYFHPQTLFAAEFLGSPKMNLIPALVTVRNGRGETALGGTQIPLPKLRAETAAEGESIFCMIGIRPEKVRIAGPLDACELEITIPGRFQGLARAGSGMQILFSIDGVPGTFSALAADHLPETENEPVRIAFRTEDLSVFEQAGGRNIAVSGSISEILNRNGGGFHDYDQTACGTGGRIAGDSFKGTQ